MRQPILKLKLPAKLKDIPAELISGPVEGAHNRKRAHRSREVHSQKQIV